MTVKEFFKSTAFKCIVVLLCVLLVSGVFLTVMNSLLAVTEQERFDRAIQKIYGQPVKTESVAISEQYNDNAEIEEAYLIKDDGNYLVKSTGKGGFDNGTVTCWVVVVVKNGAVSGIDKVIVDSNKNQSYIANINDNFLNAFKDNFVAGTPYNVNVGFLKTGATRSGNAICNAVNGAVDFVNAKFGNVKEDIFKGKPYTEFIDTGLTTAEYDESTGLVVFEVVTTGANYKGSTNMAGGFTIGIAVDDTGVIRSYNILINGSTSDTFKNRMPAEILDGSLFVGKNIDGILDILGGGVEYPGDSSDSVIATGASQSNHQCIYAAAFAAENYKLLTATEEVEVSFEGCEYTDFIDIQATKAMYNSKNGNVVFEVVTTDTSSYGGRAKAFTVNITVNGTGVIEAFNISKNGSTADRYIERMYPEILDGSLFVGKDIAGILDILGGGVEYPDADTDTVIKTGATQSNHLCLYAAAFAAENYKLVLETIGG